VVDIEPDNLWSDSCAAIFAHPAGKLGNFVFYDGHAKSRKWLQTLYPLTQNQWELVPNPDPKNHVLTSPFYQYAAPDGPAAKEFQQPACLTYQ
jgi:prepilin-type processing-associated H-X9-DG protein